MANGTTTGGVIRRPAVPRPIRIRRSVLSLAPNDPIITFYDKAINRMKTKPMDDPLSWRYQAAIHDYVRSQDPLALPGDVFPADRGTFWATCQHACWFFLPWHRMYLHHFEKIVMSLVMELGGPTDWALPYWNYSPSPAAHLLPAPFRAGSATPGLFVAQRDPNANTGLPFGRPDLPGQTGDSNITICLSEPLFTGVPAGRPGFGGLPGVNHNPGGPGKGMVEQLPHDTMHGAISGPDPRTGFMGSFTRAPLDPIFWLHHCNIDRLWEVWVKTHANPTDAAWLNQSFPFHDASGGTVSMTSSQVLDTRAEPLSYIYDDISNPLSP
jgi:tyrosinase